MQMRHPPLHRRGELHASGPIFFGKAASFKRLPCARPAGTIARMTPSDRRGSPENASPLPTVIDEELFASKGNIGLILARPMRCLLALTFAFFAAAASPPPRDIPLRSADIEKVEVTAFTVMISFSSQTQTDALAQDRELSGRHQFFVPSRKESVYFVGEPCSTSACDDLVYTTHARGRSAVRTGHS